MRNLFKQPVTPKEAPVVDKPKLVIAIEHLDAANTHMERAMGVLNSVILDWQKASSFILQYRDSLIKSIEDTGGGDIYAQVETLVHREFAPKKVREQDASEGE